VKLILIVIALLNSIVECWKISSVIIIINQLYNSSLKHSFRAPASNRDRLLGIRRHSIWWTEWQMSTGKCFIFNKSL